MKGAFKVTLAFAAVLAVVALGSMIEPTQIIGILNSAGIGNIPNGLAEGLTAATTVAEVNTLLAGAAGVSVAPPVAAAIVAAGGVAA